MNCKIRIDDIPTLAKWIESGLTPDDNTLNAHINELQSCIGDLVVFEDDYAPAQGNPPGEKYTTLNRMARSMALLLHDLKSIRREVHTARLLNES